MPSSKPVNSAGYRVVVLTLPMPPSMNHAYVTLRNGRRAKSSEVIRYHASVRRLAEGIVPITGRIAVSTVYTTPHPFGNTLRGDLNNRDKVLFDALKGVAYYDDKQICETKSCFVYKNGSLPTVKITVESIG